MAGDGLARESSSPSLALPALYIYLACIRYDSVDCIIMRWALGSIFTFISPRILSLIGPCNTYRLADGGEGHNLARATGREVPADRTNVGASYVCELAEGGLGLRSTEFIANDRHSPGQRTQARDVPSSPCRPHCVLTRAWSLRCNLSI